MPPLIAVLMFFAMLFWAGGWSALKILTNAVPLEVLTFWRYLLMFLSFLPVLFVFRHPLRLPRKGIKFILASAVLNILFMFFAYLGVDHSYAGNGGVIITILAPIFTFMLGIVLFRERHSALQYFGLLLGLLGGIIMLKLYAFELEDFLAEFYFILSAFTWAFITFLAQRANVHIHPVHYSFFIAVSASFILFFIAYPYGIGLVFDQDARFWGALLYLSLFGQTIATTIFFIASAQLGSAKASAYMFLVPVLSLVIAAIVLDEPMQKHIIIGGAISMIAVYFINRRTKRQ